MVLRYKGIFPLFIIVLLFSHCQEKEVLLDSSNFSVLPSDYVPIPCEEIAVDSVFSSFIPLNQITWDDKEILADGRFLAINKNDFGNDSLLISPLFLVDNTIAEIRCDYSWYYNGIENERLVLLEEENNLTVSTTEDNIVFYLCDKSSNLRIGNEPIEIRHSTAISFAKSLYFR